MAVYFKFKSAKDFDSVSIDGHFISVANLKDKIVEQKKLGRGSDYDLVISNAQTNEEYTDEGYLVPKNTSVIVRRVPGRPRMPIVADVKEERKTSVEVQPVNTSLPAVEPSHKNISSLPDGLDDFGIDLYAVPETIQASTVSLTAEEDDKIKAFVDASASDWQRQTQESFQAGRGYGGKGQGRGLPLRGYGNGRSFEKKNPPHGYVCHRCGVTGHYIQHCPTNGDPNYDIKKVKPPTGIPKTMLVANPDGSYALPTGEVAVLKPNEAVFEREVDGLPSSSRPVLDIPPELCCPLCKGVLKEAVLTSKCCYKSYCDQCIRHEIISKAKCVCGAKNILADDLLPNRTLRDAISRFLESQASAATSSGNVGSRMMLQDMESAPYARPKLQSPAISVSLKEASSVLVASDGSDTKEPFSGGKGPSQAQGEASAISGTLVQSSSGRKHQKEDDGSQKPIEVVDGSPESQLTKEPVQEILSSERPARSDTEHREQLSHQAVAAAGQGRTVSEAVKGKKKPKSKRVRQQVDMAYSEGMWGPTPNYNAQAEMCCQNCGSYEHPTWHCYMNGPGPSHYQPPMQGPMFGPGFNAPMRGMMHQPLGDGYMIPYHHNPAPYNGYGPSPYDMPFNGPMIPHENFAPHAGMMAHGPPMHRDYVDPTTLMSRDEFEARKAELKRRREREQRFGREQVKYPTSEGDVDTTRLQGRMARRLGSRAGRERELSPDGLEEHNQRVRSSQNVEQGRYTGARVSRPREDWSEKEEYQNSSDGEGSAHQDSYVGKARERWNSRHVDEASSGDEISDEARYSRLDAYSSKHREKAHSGKVTVDAKRSGVRSDRKADRQRKSVAYESEDDLDFRRQSGSEVGPSSPLRHVRRKAVVEEQLNRDDVDNHKEMNVTRLQDGRSSKLNLRDGQRGSVFERTNLPVKPKRVVEEEYEEVDGRELRGKRSRVSDRRISDSRVEVDRVRDFESESSRLYAGSVSRKKRKPTELMM